MKKKKSELPNFNKMTLEQEAEWFDTHSLADYWDEMEDVEIVFDLEKPRTETLVVRMQKDFKIKLRQIAKSKGLDVSTLARMWLLEKLQSVK